MLQKPCSSSCVCIYLHLDHVELKRVNIVRNRGERETMVVVVNGGELWRWWMVSNGRWEVES